MPLEVIAGPAGGGKSQVIEQERSPGDVVIDFTALYVAVAGVQRDPVTGRYPERLDGDPRLPLVSALRDRAIEEAAARELNGFVTTSDSRPSSINRLATLAAAPGVEVAQVRIIDPGEDVVRARLADPVSGALSSACESALDRWYQ